MNAVTNKELAAGQATHDAAAEQMQAAAHARADAAALAALLDEVIQAQENKSPSLQAKQARLLTILARRTC